MFPISGDGTKLNDCSVDTSVDKDKQLSSPRVMSPSDIQSKIQLNRKSRIWAFSTVGTPDYIAPEVFGNKGYGQDADWWSIGVILFEMMVGYPPFFADTPKETIQKIMKWEKYFKIPSDAKLSSNAMSLIKSMVNHSDKRLGKNGAEEIKKHPFFKGFDWSKVLSMKPPFIPSIKNDWDTSYFDKFEETTPFHLVDKTKPKHRKEIDFVNFTYKCDQNNTKGSVIHALEVLETLKESRKKQDNSHKQEILDEDEFNKAIVEENKQTISSTNQTENSKLKKNVNVFQITKTIEKPKSKSPSPQKKEKNSPVPSPKKVADIVYNKVINQSPKIKK